MTLPPGLISKLTLLPALISIFALEAGVICQHAVAPGDVPEPVKHPPHKSECTISQACQYVRFSRASFAGHLSLPKTPPSHSSFSTPPYLHCPRQNAYPQNFVRSRFPIPRFPTQTPILPISQPALHIHPVYTTIPVSKLKSANHFQLQICICQNFGPTCFRIESFVG